MPLLLRHDRLFPARAGVMTVTSPEKVEERPIPRTRGGDPWLAYGSNVNDHYSPHARG